MKHLRLKFLLATSLAIISCSLNAQSEQDDFLDKVAEHTCSCFAEKKGVGTSNEAALGTCMLTYIAERQDEYEALFGELDYSDVQAMTKLGEQIGVKMMQYCPETMMEIGQEQIDKEAETETKEKSYFVSGQIEGVSGEEVAVVSMKQLDGKPIKLYWLEYFPGSEILGRQKNASLPVEVEYVNVDLYSPATKEYVTRRKIVAMRVLE